MCAMTPEQREKLAEAGNFAIDLILAPDDPPTDHPAFRKELSPVTTSLRMAGVPYTQIGNVTQSIGGSDYPLPEFFVALKVLAPPAIGALTGVITAWIGGRSGRKMRLKVGDIEAEGQTSKEIDELLRKAAEFRDRSQTKDDA